MTSNALTHDLFQRMTMFVCPICHLLHDMSDRRINQLLYEHVTDPDFITNFLKGNGFCHYHSEAVLRKGDPLAHAILYSHLIDQSKPLFTPSKLKEKPSRKNDECYLCTHEKRNEKNYTDAFIKSYMLEYFQAQYQKQGMLCLTHFNLIKRDPNMIKNAYYQRFLLTTEEKYHLLYDVLSEIKRKSDYRFKDEAWTTREKKAWKQVVSLTVDQYDHLRKKHR